MAGNNRSVFGIENQGPSDAPAFTRAVFPEDLKVSEIKIIDPQDKILLFWNKLIVLSCIFAVSIDPLFLFLPDFQVDKMCLQIHESLAYTTTTLRTIVDTFYVVHIVLQFRTAFIAPPSRVFGRGELVIDPKEIAQRYLHGYFYVDLFSVLPLPQIVVCRFLHGAEDSDLLGTKKALVIIVFLQYIPRFLRFIPLTSDLKKSQGVFAETAWAGAAYYLLWFMLAIHVLLKLERLHEELIQRCGGEPTFAQWAAAAGVDQKTLSEQIKYGILCKDKMIKSNISLVISIAKNYQGAGMNLQDLVQEGCRGLVRGSEKFDASKGFKLSTYAHWWIKQAVRKSLSDQSRKIRLPFHMVEATYRVKEARKQLYSENGRVPNDEEVAEATGLSMKRLTAVMMTPKAPRSLDQKIRINLDLKPLEVISDPEAETTEEILIKQFMRQDLTDVLNSLNPLEKQVITWRFGLDDGRMKTFQEIGELMGVSRERIRQIESCAFRKLKNKKRTKQLQQYVMT